MSKSGAKPSAPVLVMEREFAHPPEAVFKAWTDAEALRQWFAPKDMSAPDATMDARVGGEFTWELVSPDGGRERARGVIKELVPNRRLRFSWYWDPETGGSGQVMETTVEFEPTKSGTRLRLRQTNFISEKARDDHRDGWSDAFGKLEAYLAR